MRNCLILAMFVGFTLACQTEEPAPGEPPAPPVTEELEPGTEGEVVPDLPGADEGIRSRRRMDIDQLQASLEQVTGDGIHWTDGNTRLFDELAQTLGKPDYLDTTVSDLDPSMLFAKFLGDAARDVCQKLADQDAEAAAEDRLLIVYAGLEDTLESNTSGVEENLRYLLRRYHTVSLEEGSDLLNPWSWLFESSLYVTGDPVAAWRTVCVGLITHPDFYTY